MNSKTARVKILQSSISSSRMVFILPSPPIQTKEYMSFVEHPLKDAKTTKKSIPTESRCALTKNHRSSNPICQAASAFRVIGGKVVSASTNGQEAPVYVIQGKEKPTGDFFIQKLREWQIPITDSRILAYSRSQAARLSGQRGFDNSTSVQTCKILNSVGTLLNRKSYVERQKAIRACRLAILALVKPPKDSNQESDSSLAEAIGLTDSIIALVLLTLMKQLPRLETRKEATEQVCSVTQETLLLELNAVELKNPKSPTGNQKISFGRIGKNRYDRPLQNNRSKHSCN